MKQDGLHKKGSPDSHESKGVESKYLEDFDGLIALLVDMTLAARKKGIHTEWMDAVCDYAKWKVEQDEDDEGVKIIIEEK